MVVVLVALHIRHLTSLWQWRRALPSYDAVASWRAQPAIRSSTCSWKLSSTLPCPTSICFVRFCHSLLLLVHTHHSPIHIILFPVLVESDNTTRVSHLLCELCPGLSQPWLIWFVGSIDHFLFHCTLGTPLPPVFLAWNARQSTKCERKSKKKKEKNEWPICGDGPTISHPVFAWMPTVRYGMF